MDLLTVNHTDFTLFIDCSKFDAVWSKAVSNVGVENLTSRYTWSDGVLSVSRNGEPIEKDTDAPAVFFDNVDYPIWIDFNKDVRRAEFGSLLQSDNDRFTFRNRTLAGFVNYGNDIGRSEINIIYQIGAETRRFTFGFEVLSIKLNYHEHWQAIVEDIEREYRMLSLTICVGRFTVFRPMPMAKHPK